MAALPVNNTITAWLGYTSEGVEHEMEMRFADGTADSTIVNAATGIANALRDLMLPSDSFLSLRVRAKGSNLSFPLAFSAITGNNPNAVPAGQEPNFLSLTGRSSGGRRVRMTFFTPHAEPNERYRFALGDVTAGAAWLNQVQAGANNIVAIDGLVPVWNQYINTGTNSYWQRQRRRG